MKIFTNALKLTLAVAVAATPLTALSGSIICGGTVETLVYHQPGTLYVKLSGMNTFVGICSVDATWTAPGSLFGSTTVGACKTIYASLLVAKQAGTNITSMYLDGDSVPATCTSFPSWTSANLRYFAI